MEKIDLGSSVKLGTSWGVLREGREVPLSTARMRSKEGVPFRSKGGKGKGRANERIHGGLAMVHCKDP